MCDTRLMLLSQSYYFSIISSTDSTLMGAFVQGLLHVLREPYTCNSKVARADYHCFVIHNVTSKIKFTECTQCTRDDREEFYQTQIKML